MHIRIAYFPIRMFVTYPRMRALRHPAALRDVISPIGTLSDIPPTQ